MVIIQLPDKVTCVKGSMNVESIIPDITGITHPRTDMSLKVLVWVFSQTGKEAHNGLQLRDNKTT